MFKFGNEEKEGKFLLASNILFLKCQKLDISKVKIIDDHLFKCLAKGTTEKTNSSQITLTTVF